MIFYSAGSSTDTYFFFLNFLNANHHHVFLQILFLTFDEFFGLYPSLLSLTHFLCLRQICPSLSVWCSHLFSLDNTPAFISSPVSLSTSINTTHNQFKETHAGDIKQTLHKHTHSLWFLICTSELNWIWLYSQMERSVALEEFSSKC